MNSHYIKILQFPNFQFIFTDKDYNKTKSGIIKFALYVLLQLHIYFALLGCVQGQSANYYVSNTGNNNTFSYLCQS